MHNVELNPDELNREAVLLPQRQATRWPLHMCSPWHRGLRQVVGVTDRQDKTSEQHAVDARGGLKRRPKASLSDHEQTLNRQSLEPNPRTKLPGKIN